MPADSSPPIKERFSIREDRTPSRADRIKEPRGSVEP
jgi:hypothetical protein